MANVRALIELMRSKPTEMREDEVTTVLQFRGYARKAGSGTSHRRFVSPGHVPVHFPVHGGKVQRAYLIKIIRLLDLEEEDHG